MRSIENTALIWYMGRITLGIGKAAALRDADEYDFVMDFSH